MVQTHRILDFTTNIAKRGFRAGRPTRQGILQGAEERVFTLRGRPFPDPGALGDTHLHTSWSGDAGLTGAT